MNQRRRYFANAYDDHQKNIYVLGGEAPSGYLTHCEVFSITDDTWKVMAPMPCKKMSASACIVNT